MPTHSPWPLFPLAQGLVEVYSVKLQPIKATGDGMDVVGAEGGGSKEDGGDDGADQMEGCGLEFVAGLDGVGAVPVTDSSGMLRFIVRNVRRMWVVCVCIVHLFVYR